MTDKLRPLLTGLLGLLLSAAALARCLRGR